MKNETFLKSLLNIETIEQKEKREKAKREKQAILEAKRKQKEKLKEGKELKEKIVSFKVSLETLKKENQKWFWISLFQKRDTNDKNFLIEYIQKQEKVSRKIKSELIKEIQKGNIIDIETIEKCISILSIENLIEKEQKEDSLEAIELENELNHFIEGIQGNKTGNILEKNIQVNKAFRDEETGEKVKTKKRINVFYMVSNAMKRLKYIENKKGEKYEDLSNNFFGIDEAKNKINIVSENYNNKYIIEQLQKEKGRETFYNIYKNLELEKAIFKEKIETLKQELKAKVKEIEARLDAWESQWTIDTRKIQKIKLEIEELQKERNIHKTSENRALKNIIKNWDLEKYL